LTKKSFLKQKMQTKKAFFCQPFFEKIQGLCRGPPFKYHFC